MQVTSEIQVYQSLAFLRPKGVVAHADIELLVNWMIRRTTNQIEKFLVNLSQASIKPEVALLLVRMADMALGPKIPIAVCLPEDNAFSAVSSKVDSARVHFISDESSALDEIGPIWSFQKQGHHRNHPFILETSKNPADIL